MSKKSMVMVILSLINWIPVLNLLLSHHTLTKFVFLITYLSLLIWPIIAIVIIILLIRTLYLKKTFNIFYILIIVSNIAFLFIGIKYLKSVAWIV